MNPLHTEAATLAHYVIQRRQNVTTTPTRKPIDYERMQKVFPGQKRAVQKLVKTKDGPALKKLAVEIVDVWDEIGAWPDDWAFLQRALDDVLPWREGVSLDQLVLQDRQARRQEREQRAAEAARAHAEAYPEHTKLAALEGKNETVGQFLDWLEEEGIVLARYGDDTQENGSSTRLYPIYDRKAALIGRHFDISEATLDLEKKAMLDSLQTTVVVKR